MMNALRYLCVVGVMTTTPALAAITPLTPGQTVPLSGITLADDPTLTAATNAQSDVFQPFVISNDVGELYRGTLQSKASWRDATGTIDFTPSR